MQAIAVWQGSLAQTRCTKVHPNSWQYCSISPCIRDTMCPCIRDTSYQNLSLPLFWCGELYLHVIGKTHFAERIYLPSAVDLYTPKQFEDLLASRTATAASVLKSPPKYQLEQNYICTCNSEDSMSLLIVCS